MALFLNFRILSNFWEKVCFIAHKFWGHNFMKNLEILKKTGIISVILLQKGSPGAFTVKIMKILMILQHFESSKFTDYRPHLWGWWEKNHLVGDPKNEFSKNRFILLTQYHSNFALLLLNNSILKLKIIFLKISLSPPNLWCTQTELKNNNLFFVSHKN